MIRITFLLRRKAELSPEAFRDYWLNEHGPLVASVAGKINAMRYVQVHTIADHPAPEAMAKARGGMEGVYGALNTVDQTLTKKFLVDLPDLDIELYVDAVAIKANGFNEDDLVDEVEMVDMEKISELIEEAEASLVF